MKSCQCGLLGRYYRVGKIWIYLDTNLSQIVPKGSTMLDRYIFIGIHTNHMDMTKFVNKQDPDYRNVLSELQRFIQPGNYQSEKKLPLASSVSSKSQEQSHHGARNESSSTGERDSRQSTKSVNTFSGTFNTNGGKMIQGSEFNSGGGSMSF